MFFYDSFSSVYKFALLLLKILLLILIIKYKKKKKKAGTAYFKKEPHFLIDQSGTQHIFMLHKVYIFFNQPGNWLSWKALFLRNRNRFYLNSRSKSEINRVCSNEWTFVSIRH